MNLSFVFHFCLLCAFGNAYLGVSNSSGFGSSETDNCKRGVSVKQNETVCYELRHNTCFDTVLPYSYSTSALVNPTLTQQRLQVKLFFLLNVQSDGPYVTFHFNRTIYLAGKVLGVPRNAGLYSNHSSVRSICRNVKAE